MYNTWTINRYSDLLVLDTNSSIYKGITTNIVSTMLQAISIYSEENLMNYVMTELKYDTDLEKKETCGYALLSKIGFGEYNEIFFNTYNSTGKSVNEIVQDIKLMK